MRTRLAAEQERLTAGRAGPGDTDGARVGVAEGLRGSRKTLHLDLGEGGAVLVVGRNPSPRRV